MSKLLQPIIDKYQRWNRERKYKRDKYFKISTPPSDELLSILKVELLAGPYKGVVYSYGPITIGDNLGYRGADASYELFINVGENNLLNDKKFTKIVSDILLLIIDEAVKAQAEKFALENLNEEIREDYIEEPVPQRTVSKKNPTVSKKRVSSGKKRKTGTRRGSKVRSSVQQDSDV